MPRPEVAFACGSRSTTSARWPASARQAARLIAVVVIPTPPFWVARAKILATRPLSLGQRTLPRHAGAPRESRRRRRELREHDEAVPLLGLPAAEEPGDPRDGREVGGGAEPQ